ncbi:MAG TPA: hypothetical protein VGK61_10575 [Planctomycetota bacterium]
MKSAFALAGLLALCGSASAQEDSGASQEIRKVKDRLASMRITLDFQNAKLEDVIAYFQEYSGLNFHLDAEVAKAGEEPARVTIKLKDVSLKTALKLVLNPRDLGCVYRDGVLLITSKARLGGMTVTRVYDVRDLLFRIRDFPGPRVELVAPGGAGAALAGASFTIEEEPKSAITEDFLADLIKTNTGDKSWEDAGATSVSQVNGLLVISQSKPVHEEIRRLLDLLRQFK